jgi:PAS domain S-box-containing protein
LVVGVLYFVAARLSLALLTKPDGVAVFWPAAGVSAGLLIAFGPWARWPVAAAVMAATVAANLLGDRNLGSAVVFALCNAGEAVLAAWLIQRHFGLRFSLDSVRNVLGLFGSAAVAAAVSGVGGTAGFIVFHNSGTPFLTTWLNWFASDALGIVTVAPLVIGLVRSIRDRPATSEIAEGLFALAVVALVSAVGFGSGKDHWFTILPLSFLLPLLFCVAAYCRPVFVAAAAFIITFSIVWTITFDIGRLGDPSVPLVNRVYAAQAALLAISVGTLVPAALFSERRDHEAALKNSNRQLQLALDCAELGTWSLHLQSGRFENDVRDRLIHGHGSDASPKTLPQMRSQVHPDDLSKLDAAFGELAHAGGSCRTEYRLAPRNDQERAARERWVTLEGTVVRRANGRAEQLLGVTRDITERKHAEEALRQREVELSEAQRLAHIGSWYWIAEADVPPVASDELLRIFGIDPATQRVPTLRDQRGRWYPVADWERLMAAVQKTMRTGVGYELELQAFRNETPIWVTARGAAVCNSTGQIVGLRGTVQDITERKSAERMLAERNLQLHLAAKIGLVGSYTYDPQTDIGQISPGCAAIHGFPEGTTEITRGEWAARVHPEDVERMQQLRSEALRERREEYNVDYRVFRRDGEVRWIESRVFILYGSDATTYRLNGVNIDVTERKRAEVLIKDSKTRLADALAAGQVIAFEWDALARLSQRSDNAADILGFDHGGLPFLSYVHPDDRTKLKTQIRELRPRSPSYALTFRYVRPDGGLVWLEETARGEFDFTGKLVRIKGLTRDITHHKQAEQALAERNAQLALAGKVALVGSYSYDVNTGAMQVSKGYAAVHGLPEGTTETTLDQWWTKVHPEDLERVVKLRDQTFADQRDGSKIEFRIIRSGGEVRWIEKRNFITYDGDGRPRRVVGVTIDVTERKRAEEQQRVLVSELDHRVKNTLATVSAIVSHTLNASSSMADFATALDGRVQSMARTHELLSANRWHGISVAELVRREVAPYATTDNTEINGPEVTLRAEAGQAMAMVLHELATNAAKYGALSTHNGRVSINWEQRLNGHPRSHLVLEWREFGGPSVITPGKPGYGTRTIRDLIPYELRGRVDLAFTPEGVQCSVELPVDWLSSDSDPAREGRLEPKPIDGTAGPCCATRS